MTTAAVRSKAVVLLLLCQCSLWLPLFVFFVFGHGFDMQYLVPLLFLQSFILAEEERAGCFFNCLPAVLWLCVVSWVVLLCVIVVHAFPGYTHFFVISSILRSNRSALLCNLVIYASLLAVDSMNYLTIIIAIADLF